MSKLKRVALVVAVTAMTILPASPALATHRCGLDDVPVVGPLCEAHPSDWKLIVNYVACLALPTC